MTPAKHANELHADFARLARDGKQDAALALVVKAVADAEGDATRLDALAPIVIWMIADAAVDPEHVRRPRVFAFDLGGTRVRFQVQISGWCAGAISYTLLPVGSVGSRHLTDADVETVLQQTTERVREIVYGAAEGNVAAL